MESVKYPYQPVLLVDDEREILDGLEFLLQSNGINNIITCQQSTDVLELMEDTPVMAVLLDLLMPGLSGNQLLDEMTQKHPEVPVTILTGLNDLDTAVNCMKAGAFDYLVKPVEEQRLITCVKRAIERQEERSEYKTFKELVLKDDLIHPEAFAEIITANKTIRSIFQYVEAIAITNKPVLITGASGVGKELMAKAIHSLSRKDSSFIPVNISGLDETLFSDALFGHVKGAFTGAESIRKGMIENAVGGTLFMDEIGDLNPASQIKLLRLLEEGEYFPVGSDVPKESSARIIAATNRDLLELRKKGEFRTDLYYRLQTHHIHLPPLAERIDDLPLLVDHFLTQAADNLGKKKPTAPKELVPLLASYHFPGNIRELQSMIFDAVSHHRAKVLSLRLFRDHIKKHSTSPIPKETQIKNQEFYKFSRSLPTLAEARKMLVDEAMQRADGNITNAARILGITRSGLSKLIKRIDDNGPN